MDRHAWVLARIGRPCAGTLLIGAGVALLYAALFVLLYPRMGVIAGSLSVVPIALGGWRFGRRGGVLVGLASVPLHILLFGLAGASGALMVLQNWPGSLMGVLVGAAVGWLREVLERSRRQAAELARAKADLLDQIAARELVEQDLRAAMLAASAADEAKSVFLGTISHELRTPLTSIMGYSELLERELVSHGLADLQADVHRIQAAGERLLTLITSMLEFTHIEAGVVEVLPGRCDLPLLLGEVAERVRPLIAQHGNIFAVRTAPDLPELWTDRAKLRQILIHLLVNAAASTERGQVTLEARLAPGGVQLSVADTGTGIDPQLLPNLFEPFVHNANLSQRGGVGLGLALCQRLSHLLGGTINVSSTPGAGATFTVLLPLVWDQPGAPSPAAPAEPALR